MCSRMLLGFLVACANKTKQVLKVMAKKLVRKALEMLRKLAAEEPEDEEGEVSPQDAKIRT